MSEPEMYEEDKRKRRLAEAFINARRARSEEVADVYNKEYEEQRQRRAIVDAGDAHKKVQDEYHGNREKVAKVLDAERLARVRAKKEGQGHRDALNTEKVAIVGKMSPGEKHRFGEGVKGYRKVRGMENEERLAEAEKKGREQFQKEEGERAAFRETAKKRASVFARVQLRKAKETHVDQPKLDALRKEGKAFVYMHGSEEQGEEGKSRLVTNPVEGPEKEYINKRRAEI